MGDEEEVDWGVTADEDVLSLGGEEGERPHQPRDMTADTNWEVSHSEQFVPVAAAAPAPAPAPAVVEKKPPTGPRRSATSTSNEASPYPYCETLNYF